jgi:Stress responsive A/B Barrel Domain
MSCNFDFAVVADFEDAASYLAYRDHPAHRAVINECITPIRQDRASVQYET